MSFPVKAAGYIAKARDWDELARQFRQYAAEDGRFVPHLQFCERMAGSADRERIYAITSFGTFTISNTPEFDTGAEVLRMDFENGEAVMEFVEQPGVTTRWRRRYPEDQAFDAVIRLARRKRWFIEYSGPGVADASV